MADQGRPSSGQMAWLPLASTAEAGGRAPSVICPFCHAPDAEPMAMYGAQLLTDQYYCPICRTPFEHLRDQPGRE